MKISKRVKEKMRKRRKKQSNIVAWFHRSNNLIYDVTFHFENDGAYWNGSGEPPIQLNGEFFPCWRKTLYELIKEEI